MHVKNISNMIYWGYFTSEVFNPFFSHISLSALSILRNLRCRIRKALKKVEPTPWIGTRSTIFFIFCIIKTNSQLNSDTADVVSVFRKKKYGLIFRGTDPCIDPVYLIYSQTVSFFEIPNFLGKREYWSSLKLWFFWCHH